MAGDITLAPDGTGEGSFRINPADMNGQGLALSDCSDVIVAAMSRVDPREALHPVMSGSIAFPRSIAETSTGTSAAKKTPRDYSPFYSRFVLDSCIKIAQKQNSFADIKPFTDDYRRGSGKRSPMLSLFPDDLAGLRATDEKIRALPLRVAGHPLLPRRSGPLPA